MNDVTEANVKIIFCRSEKKNEPFFNEFILNESTFNTNAETEINVQIPFNQFELNLGKKVCEYSLHSQQAKNEENEVKGLIEIYLGNNVGFCFIDSFGLTFLLSFVNTNGSIEEFAKNDFVLTDRRGKFSKGIKLTSALDRANILLINCPFNSQLVMTGRVILNFLELINKVESFSEHNSYQLL